MLLRVSASLGSVHQVVQHCHSEPFGKTCRRAQVESLRTGSAKNLPEKQSQEILRRPAAGGTPQNDNRKGEVRMDTDLLSR
jgi:hypothetical protein